MRQRSATVTIGLAAALAFTVVPALAQEAGSGNHVCYDDPAGDVVNEADDTAVEQPKADIIEFCVMQGPTTSVHLSLAEPTDPDVDAGWQDATFAGWFVDTDGDEGGDYFIDYSIDPEFGAAQARVVPPDEAGAPASPLCTMPAALTSTGISLVGLTAECLEGATDISVSPAMFYDDGEVVATDSATTPEGTFAPITLGDPAERGIGRHFGATRIETSVAISQAQFPNAGDAERVYLARYDILADAVAGGALTDGPILIVRTCDDPEQVVLDEIERLGVDEVVGLGGTAAICDDTLVAAGGTADGRIFGPTRFETAAEIARVAYPEGADRVYIAESRTFADAVAGGSLTDGPVLLVPECAAVPTAVTDVVAEMEATEVVALGGTAAICGQVLADVAGDLATSRLAGVNRLETAVAIARHSFPEPGATNVYLANGFRIVDALVGGTLTDGPILLVGQCSDITEGAAAEVGVELMRHGHENVIGLGGTVALCDDTLNAAGGL